MKFFAIAAILLLANEINSRLIKRETEDHLAGRH